jgi:hypothetical protein
MWPCGGDCSPSLAEGTGGSGVATSRAAAPSLHIFGSAARALSGTWPPSHPDFVASSPVAHTARSLPPVAAEALSSHIRHQPLMALTVNLNKNNTNQKNRGKFPTWMLQGKLWVMMQCLLASVTLALLPCATAAAVKCENPGGQFVARDDGTKYPYFGMPCAGTGPSSACGQCFLDETCSCHSSCCAANPGPVGYACLPNGTDTLGDVRGCSGVSAVQPRRGIDCC